MADITVASTTDTQEDINAAAGLPADGGATPPEQEATPGAAGTEPEAQNVPGSEPGKSEAKPKDVEQPPAAAKPEPAAGSEPASEEEEGKKKGSLQRRIDKLTAKTYSQADEIAELRRKLTEATAGAAKPTEPEVKADEKPVRDKFKSDAEYYEALGRWGAKQEVAEAQAKTAEEQEQAALEQTYGVYNKAVNKFRSEHDDFDEVVGREDLMIPAAVQVAVVELGDAGPAVAYYLGQHPEVCEKLNEMSDARAVVELGRIAVQLEKAAPATLPPVAAAPAAAAPAAAAPAAAAAAPAPRKPVSKAPAPTAPVGTSKTATTPLDELDYQNYKHAREREIRARRGL